MITYRKIKHGDYKEVRALINESFGLYQHFKNENLLKVVLKLYLYSCLSEKTYTCVAINDNKVIGVIMGNSKKKFSILRNLFFIFLTFIYNIKIRIMTKGKKELIQDFLNIHTIYAELLASHLNKFDGILTLFAVDKKCQGVGVGKQLLNNLFCYLGQCRVKNIYLFTDSSCNYGFYDHQGFVCLEETSLQMGDSAAYLDVYLYAKNFS